MDVFKFREQLVTNYERFTRSFAQIKAPDIEQIVDQAYKSERFWSAPLIQLNPHFQSGGYVHELVEQGLLDEQCEELFRHRTAENPVGDPLRLHQHQVDAIKIAQREQSYVLTTGTGSGKSLAYFIPIVDFVLKQKRNRSDSTGITAIVVYPMNALCNSQMDELQKYLSVEESQGHESLVTFARYTGQESLEQRIEITKNPPDILLTNYVMLELIMTRANESDRAVREHATGLKFLVLDELHTYRGRQGADMALLVRRVRERFNDDLICIGTSATMASERSRHDRNRIVAEVSTRLFGTEVNPENVVSETLRPMTDHDVSVDLSALRTALEDGVPSNPTHEEMAKHPIAAWIEGNLGFKEDDGKLVRIPRPLTIQEAAEKLSSESGVNETRCQEYLTQFLLAAHNARDSRNRSFVAFRLHQFISGAWNVYTTLESANVRYLTLNGQQFQPGYRDRPLYSLCFCRICGQEYIPVSAVITDSGGLDSFESRDLSDQPNRDQDQLFGFLMPLSNGESSSLESEIEYPEEWCEWHNHQRVLKPHFRQYRPHGVMVDTTGSVINEGGLSVWYIPGKFRFCLNQDCDAFYEGSVRSDHTKLSTLSSEGRSSATTMLSLYALKYLIDSDLDNETKKLLAFTDNRQDASLQAGHFNDFILILLLRGALLSAVKASNAQPLTDDDLTHRVFSHLGITPNDYASNPDAKGFKAQNTLNAIRDILGYRLYFDLQRGWRVTNPNLEQLGLLKIHYRNLRDCCDDEVEWAHHNSLLGNLDGSTRFKLCNDLLERMRRALCIKTIYLDPNFQEQMRNRSFNELREPWGLAEREEMSSHAVMIPRPRKRNRKYRSLHISYRSNFGRALRRECQQFQTESSGTLAEGQFEVVYNQTIDHMLKVLTTYGYIEPVEIDSETTGYQINSTVLEWHIGEQSISPDSSTNLFFWNLYLNVSELLNKESQLFYQLEAREHTAQVDSEVREERETRFRKGLNDQGLPLLFCSPTMELGVDIATLNAVYMRNVPPTPANYVQRSGRAGRSGQPALVVTYCAAQSPHDQYFFSSPDKMVAGAVNPPNIDLANEDLIRSHLQAVWLGETGVDLGPSVRDVLDLDEPKKLPVLKDFVEHLESSRAQFTAKQRAERIVNTLNPAFNSDSAPWFSETWLSSAMNSTVRRFHESFNRWRSLFNATSNQMKRANEVLKNASASDRDRKDAKSRYDEAYTQQNLLLDSRFTMNSDFYTYRYLAAEGFLPGYNFPRLPLMAFIPGRREKVVRDSFLSRPRFLGLSEFGPRSIIYHEGSTYRVDRAILAVHDEESVSVDEKLPMRSARICPSCGYGHFGESKDFEVCVSCDQHLEGGKLITNLYRIEQVSTRRANRITSDEEVRQRQGYEMITTLKFSEENGKARVVRHCVEESNEPLLQLHYGPAATLWRINLGWRRRQEKNIYGFTVDTNTGEWAKDAQAPTDVEEDAVGVVGLKSIERITPFVEDSRNVLIVSPEIELSDSAMISLQYALKRGIEQEYQLEESELAVEPLPDRDNRTTILYYESTEGGAGVLTRLVSDHQALARIAKRALETCHYQTDSDRSPLNTEGLTNVDPDCEAGCYRCLLSYFNQSDHPQIDRRNQELIDLLCRLTRSTHIGATKKSDVRDSSVELHNVSTSSLEKEWLDFIQSKGYHLPDKGQLYFEEYETRPDFGYTQSQTLIYVDGPHHHTKAQTEKDDVITNRLVDAGFTVIRFPVERSTWPGIVAKYSWLFGTGKSKLED